MIGFGFIWIKNNNPADSQTIFLSALFYHDA